MTYVGRLAPLASGYVPPAPVQSAPKPPEPRKRKFGIPMISLAKYDVDPKYIFEALNLDRGPDGRKQF